MAQVIGDRWQIKEQVGEGGQAWTYRVVDLQSAGKAIYALKKLKNRSRVKRFASEIAAIQNLAHDNLIHLVESGLDADPPYLVMEYCSGGSFRKNWTARVGTDIALASFVQICDGLAVAHRAGVIHRDIKPDNILIREPNGRPVIADFGLCYIGDEERATSSSEAVGAWHFMAPELEDGRLENVTSAADVYSLGKLLYWMLTGKSFSREKHRDPAYDLTSQENSGGDSRYLLITRFLDKLIVADPSLRLEDAAAVSREARMLYRVWVGGFNAVHSKLPQLCTYCGQDYYYEPISPQNFGLGATGSPRGKILICPSCGHSEIFRLDFATRQNWWDEN
jgi:serine/threonine protein kinase